MKKYPKIITLQYLESLVAEQEKKDLIDKFKSPNNEGLHNSDSNNKEFINDRLIISKDENDYVLCSDIH